MKGVSIWRPGAVIRPGRVDAMPVGQPPETVTVIEDNLSDFARLIAPVRRELAAHRWILHCPDEYLRFPEPWYGEDGDSPAEELRQAWAMVLSRSTDHGPWKYVEGRFLEAVADTLIDEWWDFFAVDGPVEDLDAWVRAFWAAARSRTLAEYLIDRVSLFCAGIDGVRWDFFAADPARVEAIHQNAIVQPGFQIRMTDLDPMIRSLYYGGKS